MRRLNHTPVKTNIYIRQFRNEMAATKFNIYNIHTQIKPKLISNCKLIMVKFVYANFV